MYLSRPKKLKAFFPQQQLLLLSELLLLLLLLLWLHCLLHCFIACSPQPHSSHPPSRDGLNLNQRIELLFGSLQLFVSLWRLDSFRSPTRKNGLKHLLNSWPPLPFSLALALSLSSVSLAVLVSLARSPGLGIQALPAVSQ